MKMTLQMIKDKDIDKMKEVESRKFRDTSLDQEKLDAIVDIKM